MASRFSVGDIVWAKMKSYPWWPALIGEPRKDVKRPSGKKVVHFVVFFGTNNYSWIAEEFVKEYEPHIEQFSACNQLSFKNALKSAEEYMAAPKKGKSIKLKAESSKANGISPKKRPLALSYNKVLKSVTKSKKRKAEATVIKYVTPRRYSECSSTGSVTNKGASEHDPQAPYMELVEHLSPYLMNKKSSPETILDESDWSTKELSGGLLNRPAYVDPVLPEATDPGAVNVPDSAVVPPTDKKIGFIGLGIMGTGIAKHLVAAGLSVGVWNRDPVKTFRFSDVGIKVYKTVSDVVEASDITFSCVSDSTAAKEVVFGKCGVLESIGPNKGYVEITSIDPKTSKDIQSAIIVKGARYLEAPVLGSRESCLTATLVILAAGDNILFDECKPCFETFAKHAFYLGDVGNAAKMNILISMLIGTSLASFAESMSLAERVNISQSNLMDIVKLGPMMCPLFIEKAKAIMEKNYNPNTRLQHMQKDLQFAMQLGHDCSQPLPTTAAANEVFKHAKSLGYSDHDIAAVYNARF